mgnify:CR=1 FL=1
MILDIEEDSFVNWKKDWYYTLNLEDLLNLLQVSMFFQRQKKYIYRLIYIKLYQSSNKIVGEIQMLDEGYTYRSVYGYHEYYNASAYCFNSIIQARKKYLYNITTLFLKNKYLNNYIRKKADSKHVSLDRYTCLYKKYFINDTCCNDVCSTCMCTGTSMDRFERRIFGTAFIEV